MQIICLEEHTIDTEISKATMARMKAEQPYFFDVGSIYQDDPSRHPSGLPSLVNTKTFMKIATEPMGDRLAAMDREGINMQVLSYTNSTQAVPPEEAAKLAAAANDRLAEGIAKHPDRFRGFSTLPWQDTDAACRETERCVKELGLRASLIFGRPGETAFLDDARYAPILATLAELNTPLFVHPGPPLRAVQEPYYGGFNKDLTRRLSLFGWGWHNEAGIQVLRLILSGAFDRYPNLKIISGHWGEMVPFFLQRLDDAIPMEVTGLRRTITQTYRDQVWVTPSGMLNLPHFEFIRTTLGCERILYSVDYPYLTMTGARSWLENLPISDGERLAIANGNAKQLLGI